MPVDILVVLNCGRVMQIGGKDEEDEYPHCG